MTTTEMNKTHFVRLRLAALIIGLLLIPLISPVSAPLTEEQAAEYFQKNCAVCHKIGGGKLIGPDLKDVTSRQDRDWLIEFMLDPQGVLNSGDQYALKLQKEANGVIMYTIPGMTREIASSLLDYIERLSRGETPSSVADTPVVSFIPPDPIGGNKIFTGAAALANGGPACINCHSGAGPTIGGGLGPDLSAVFLRLNGREALTAWLSSPPTPTMRAVYSQKLLTPDESRQLVDLFERWSQINQNYSQGNFMIVMSVLFFGFGGVVVSYLFMGGIWSQRFRSVRRRLINTVRERGRN